MISDERRLKILEYIKKKRSATTEELSKFFTVSESTIRRDLGYLAEKKLIKRSHKGAMINFPHAERSFIVNYNLMRNEKRIVAKKALNFIEDYDFIALSGGTTCYTLVSEIVNSPLQNLTILTNSINISTLILESQKEFRLIVTGGIPRKGTYECVGEIALKTIKDFNIDKFFVGVNGISLKGGISFTNMEEAEISKEIHAHSRFTYVVADHTKFNVIKRSRTLDLSEVSAIITDSIPLELNVKEFDGVKII